MKRQVPRALLLPAAALWIGCWQSAWASDETVATGQAPPSVVGAAALPGQPAPELSASGTGTSSTSDASQPPSARTSAESATPGARLPAADARTSSVRPRKLRVLLITSKDCPQCDELLAKLNRPQGDFAKLRAAGWKIGSTADSHLQVVDRDEIPDLIEQFKVHEYPTVACIDGPEVIRYFKTGCTTPLDMWTFAWLAKGVNERPQAFVPEAVRVETTNHYPLRGNHWSVDGDWNPSRETVIMHLRSGAHGSQVPVGYAIESWSLEELRSLHDNLHDMYGGGVAYGSKPAASPFSANRKISGY